MVKLPRLPLWETMPTVPAAGRLSSMTIEKVAIAR
jgi:hypothetical protein